MVRSALNVTDAFATGSALARCRSILTSVLNRVAHGLAKGGGLTGRSLVLGALNALASEACGGVSQMRAICVYPVVSTVSVSYAGSALVNGESQMGLSPPQSV